MAGLERRAVPEARSAGGTVRGAAQDGPLDRQGDEVERAEEVPELERAAEAGDRVGWPARRPRRARGLPGARDLGDALLWLARPAAGGGPGAAGRQGAPGRAGAAAQGGRAGARSGRQDLRARDRGKTVAGV